jgi:rubrerythrin
VAASSVRETTAHFVYSRFARETRNVRLKQVWTAIASVELEHYVFELTQLESGRFG